MAICYANQPGAGLPSETRLLEEVVVRLVADETERQQHDALITQHHYLGHAHAVGEVLRYVAECRGQWVAVLTFCSPARQLKAREQYLKWTSRQLQARRHLLVQNSRFLVLPSTGAWPNLASRVLGLTCARLGQDWQEAFGHPVLLAETFVDPQRFRGTCYRSANWQALGATRGFARGGQDFYVDRQHPKELWVCPLGPEALERLQAPVLAAADRIGSPPLPPPVPVPTAELSALTEVVRRTVRDPRHRLGVRHPMASVVAIATVAVAAGCQGPHAIALFAQSLNHGQRRGLGCRRRPGTRHQFDVPCERTFIRLLAQLDADQLRQACSDWMASRDPKPVGVLHLDGKVLRHTEPAPARLAADPALATAAAALDTPPAEQKPHADQALTLVNFQTPDQRLVDQIVVPRDTNEEAAVAAHLPTMDLRGVLVIGDAAHTTKANCYHLTQEQGADYLFFLKGNQPHAHAKAQQLLAGAVPPSGPVAG